MTFAAWSHTARLTVANTMFRKPYQKQWTHQLWSTGSQRQIDYILVDSSLRTSLIDCEANDDLDIKSDHRCVRSEIKVQVAAKTCSPKHHAEPKRRRKRCIGRDRPDSGKVAQYHQALDDALIHQPMDVEKLIKAVVKAARGPAEEETQPDPTESAGRHSEFLEQLLQTRRSTSNPEQRKALSKSIWKHLRDERNQARADKLQQVLDAGSGQKALAELLRGRVKRKHITIATDAAGNRVVDTDGILEVFALFYENLYTVASTGGFECPAVQQASRVTS